MLIWNKTDFIECLEVSPQYDETYDPHYVFSVTKANLRLKIAVYEDAGDVYINLFGENFEKPIVSLSLIQCSGARFVRQKGKEYLEFAPAKMFEQRYDGESRIPGGIRVSINPDIYIENFS